jgi:hypothetical protein
MSEDMSHRLRDMTQAVENVLVAAHAVTHDLAHHHTQKGEPMPPFEFNSGELSQDEKRETALMTAMKYYGPTSPLAHLWIMVRALEQLRTVWTTGQLKPSEKADARLPTGPTETSR